MYNVPAKNYSAPDIAEHFNCDVTGLYKRLRKMNVTLTGYKPVGNGLCIMITMVTCVFSYRCLRTGIPIRRETNKELDGDSRPYRVRKLLRRDFFNDRSEDVFLEDDVFAPLSLMHLSRLDKMAKCESSRSLCMNSVSRNLTILRTTATGGDYLSTEQLMSILVTSSI